MSHEREYQFSIIPALQYSVPVPGNNKASANTGRGYLILSHPINNGKEDDEASKKW